jgi:hypothetical protein
MTMCSTAPVVFSGPSSRWVGSRRTLALAADPATGRGIGTALAIARVASATVRVASATVRVAAPTLARAAERLTRLRLGPEVATVDDQVLVDLRAAPDARVATTEAGASWCTATLRN